MREILRSDRPPSLRVLKVFRVRTKSRTFETRSPSNFPGNFGVFLARCGPTRSQSTIALPRRGIDPRMLGKSTPWFDDRLKKEKGKINSPGATGSRVEFSHARAPRFTPSRVRICREKPIVQRRDSIRSTVALPRKLAKRPGSSIVRTCRNLVRRLQRIHSRVFPFLSSLFFTGSLGFVLLESRRGKTRHNSV